MGFLFHNHVSDLGSFNLNREISIIFLVQLYTFYNFSFLMYKYSVDNIINFYKLILYFRYCILNVLFRWKEYMWLR